MRRISAIFLLFIFLMYQTGYIGIYWLAERKIDQYWMNKVSFRGPVKKISIPISLPYWIDDPHFVPTDGKLTLNGREYRKISQQYAQDSLHILVVEDRLTSNLKKSLADWINQTTDTQSEKSGKTALHKFDNKEFLGSLTSSEDPPGSESLTTSHFCYFFSVKSHHEEINIPPPRA